MKNGKEKKKEKASTSNIISQKVEKSLEKIPEEKEKKGKKRKRESIEKTELPGQSGNVEGVLNSKVMTYYIYTYFPYYASFCQYFREVRSLNQYARKMLLNMLMEALMMKLLLIAQRMLPE